MRLIAGHRSFEEALTKSLIFFRPANVSGTITCGSPNKYQYKVHKKLNHQLNANTPLSELIINERSLGIGPEYTRGFDQPVKQS